MSDLEMKIQDQALELKVLNKNVVMYKEHMKELETKITQLMAIDEAHKNINGLLRVRLNRMEEENKKLREEIKDNKKLIEDLYDYP